MTPTVYALVMSNDPIVPDPVIPDPLDPDDGPDDPDDE
jgi:hypothetical protein